MKINHLGASNRVLLLRLMAAAGGLIIAFIALWVSYDSILTALLSR